MANVNQNVAKINYQVSVSNDRMSGVILETELVV